MTPALDGLIKRWRDNADRLAEANKSEWADPAAVMQRVCADELAAMTPPPARAQTIGEKSINDAIDALIQKVGSGNQDANAERASLSAPPAEDDELGPCGHCDQQNDIFYTTDDEVDLCEECFTSLRDEMTVRNLTPVPKAATTTLSAPENGWQPIETAPRDGTMLLVYYVEGGMAVRRIDKTGMSRDVLGNKGGAPTHWMPLPAAPSRPIEAEHKDVSNGY